MPHSVIVIGAGFAGISAATSLAQKGYQVTVLEKHDMPGGRARMFETEGFKFDMGPSWYWMPDVFDSYFDQFGKKPSDYYELERLNPSYRVYFGEDDFWDIPAEMEGIEGLLDSVEEGAGGRLREFLAEAEYKYEVGINDLVYKPGRSLLEFADWRVIKGVFKLQLFRSFSKHVRKYFSHPRILSLIEFPVLFLGAKPQDTPALYSLMNYADMQLGTWYPKGGMHEIVKGMVKLAEEMGVKFEYNSEVKEIKVESGEVKEIVLADRTLTANIVVGGADYNHIEQHLLPAHARKYDEAYWEKRTMAPSSLLFYLGINKRLKNLLHHNLFFDEGFNQHAVEIYDEAVWPTKPLFYACVPSLTDDTVAPEGMENLFLLMPVAPGLDSDTEEIREKYYDIIMERLERLTGQSVREHVVYKRSYAHRDFITDYHAFKGNAYGLANTLMQTAILKPSLKSKKVKNLFYTGQLTVPGPGVPPSLISGTVVAREIEKEFKNA